MKTWHTLTIATLALGGLLGADEIRSPEYESRDVYIKGSVAIAQEERTHNNERIAYMEAHKSDLNIPQEAIDKAYYAKEEFEKYLLRKKMVDDIGGTIKEEPKSILGGLLTKTKTAYAYTFGKEDFESCVSIPCTFTSDGSYDLGAMALDATSKVNGTDSVRCDIGGAGAGCVLQKTLTSDNEYYIQFTVLFPTGWTFGASGYLTLFATEDGSGNPMYCNVEDYGSVRLICDGDELAYTDTSINIALNTATKLEFKLRISNTTGDFDIWANNNTEGSPTYNGSGTLNTGTQNITGFWLGGYHPDVVNDRWYDDAIVDVSFIGAGTSSSGSATSSTPVRINGGTIRINQGTFKNVQ